MKLTAPASLVPGRLGLAPDGYRSQRSVLLLAVFAAVIATGASCTHGEELLWVPEGAVVNVRRERFRNGSAHVGFTLRDHPNRTAFVARLREHFEGTGWRPRETDWLDGTPTPSTRGWRPGAGGIIPLDSHGRLAPVLDVYLWSGQWERPTGEVVSYELITASGSLRAYATYRPARLVGEVLGRLDFGQ